MMTGCEMVQRVEATWFEPVSDTEFRYAADMAWPYTESDRRRWMEEDLQNNAMCPNGYEITSQRIAIVSSTPFGDMEREVTRGRCLTEG